MQCGNVLITPSSPHISLLVFPHLIATEFTVKYNKGKNRNRHIPNFVSNVDFGILNQICTEFIRINMNAVFLHLVYSHACLYSVSYFHRFILNSVIFFHMDNSVLMNQKSPITNFILSHLDEYFTFALMYQ